MFNRPFYNNNQFQKVYHILLTKATAARNEGALSYLRVRGLYFLAVVFVATIVSYSRSKFNVTATI